MPLPARLPPQLIGAVFTLEDARQAGVTRWQLAGPAWHRLGRGLYASAQLAPTSQLILQAIYRRLPAGAAFSGPTAGWLHGLDLEPCNPIEVTIPRAVGVSARAGTWVRLAALAAGEVVPRRGLPTTSAIRTVTDLGRRSPIVEAVVAVDMALHRKLVCLDDLRAYAGHNPGAAGIASLRRVIDLAEPRAESAMETRLRLLLVLAGLPRPEAQVPIYADHGHFLGRPDLFYRRQRLAIEYDGGTHRDRLVEDNRRQNRLIGAGLNLLRFTAPDVLRTPAAVVLQVRSALAAADNG